MSDNVNHPDHYNTGSIEVIAAIDEYIARAGHKENAVEDLRKAIWHLHHEIDMLEAENARLKVEADARKYVRCDNCVHSVDKSIPPMLWCLAKGIRVFGGGCCEMFMDRKEYEGACKDEAD